MTILSFVVNMFVAVKFSMSLIILICYFYRICLPFCNSKIHPKSIFEKNLRVYLTTIFRRSELSNNITLFK